MLRSPFRAIVLLVIALLVLGGCGTQTPPAQPAQPAKAAPAQPAPTKAQPAAPAPASTQPAPAATKAPAKAREPVTIKSATSAFGTIANANLQAVSELMAKKNSWVKITNAEGPGCTGSTYRMLTDPVWQKTTIGCSGLTDFGYAENGLEVYKGKPVPDVRDQIKILWNYLYSVSGFISFDPKIQSLNDMHGKAVGVGRRAQVGWGALPALIFEHGLPNVKPRIDFLGPEAAYDALADNRVQAAWLTTNMYGDSSGIAVPAVYQRLVSTVNKKPYFIGFDQAVHDRFNKGSGLTRMLIPVGPQQIPEAQFHTAPQNATASFTAIAVHKNFPEDVAYEVVKFLIDNIDDFVKYNAEFKAIGKPKWLAGPWKPGDFHPGARRAFQDAGVLPK